MDGVDERARDLFAWVLREGLTNVVRHSRATTCTVTISSDTVEIVDDGVGGPAAAGSGLRGLEERVDAAGARMASGPAQPTGWRLRVTCSFAVEGALR
ncbi:MAG: sensor histidine kinase [Acidimicrobiales bacterium]